jgi:copper(I)-binding protein
LNLGEEEMKHLMKMAIALLVVVAVIGAAGVGYSSAHAHDDATPTAVSTGAAYFTIANSGAETDRLIAASTDMANVVEVHEIVNADGVMQMRPVEGGIEIPAGGTVDLAPGGYHIMLIGLTESLVDGQSYELTLTFEVAGDVTVMVPIFASETAALAATPAAPVTAGTLTITGIWSRSAPAMEQAASS